MIVSITLSDNREKEIADAIRSVVEHVDRVLLVDTGITDRTIERAREVAGSRLTTVRHEWSDFATARNAGLDAAAELGATWSLIVDSDERINFGSVHLRSALSKTPPDVDVLLVESDDGLYPKQRLIRTKSRARFYGPTHEALIGGHASLLHGVTFRELPKTPEQIEQRCLRDIEVLTAFIAEHPDDPRWHYYLGESLSGLDEKDLAAEAFGRCVELRKTGDEAAWAAFRQAEQLFALDRFEEAIRAATRGLAANPSFGECAWIAAECALKLDRKDHAVAWAKMSEAVGRHKGVPLKRVWFQHLPALYELPYSVLRVALPDAAGRDEAELNFRAAQRARIRAIEHVGNRDLDWISISRSAPASSRDEAGSLLRPKPIANMCPSARAFKIQFDPPGGRLPMNPSICTHNGEVWCVVRAVNYSMKGRRYTVHDPHGIVRTENYIGRLKMSGSGAQFIEPMFMRDLDPSPRQPSQIVGYEDIRLVSIDGRSGSVLTGSATVCDRDPEGRRLIARLHFDRSGNVKRADVQPSNQLHEKNWMPLAVNGKLTWIYSLDPTAILPGPLRECPFKLSHLRGGAAIGFGSGYLCVTHEVVDTNEGRIYLHRFVRLDERFFVTAVSPAWVFAHHGIEFCAGMIRMGGDLVLSYGFEDREAWVVRIKAKEIEALKWITP